MTKVLLLKLYPTHELPTLSFDAHFSPCEKSQKRNLKARHKTRNKDIGAKCEFQNERLGLQIYLLEKLEFAANYTLIRNSVLLWNKSVCLGNCTGCRCSDCSYNYNKSISILQFIFTTTNPSMFWKLSSIVLVALCSGLEQFLKQHFK